jgi:hypothetical protein
VFACYESEHDDELADLGWTEHEWHTGEMGGYGASGTGQQHRERLWASPHCLSPMVEPEQPSLF